MPVVSIRYNPKITISELKSLLPPLCETLARQLTCQHNGKDIIITPEMVKVRFDVASELDTHMHDLHIEIEARAFEARRPHLDAYSAEVIATVKPLLLTTSSVSVWYKLCQASWYPETARAHA